MVGRFGSIELSVVCNYLGVNFTPHWTRNVYSYIQSKRPAWWWRKGLLECFQTNAGFFCNDTDNVTRFCEMMLEDMTLLDVLGSWRKEEHFVKERIHKAKTTPIAFLEPFWADVPWTEALEGKKVLVVHPFAKQIEKQYERRKVLFKDPRMLPAFELETIQAVQTIGGENAGFHTWFDALDSMKQAMDEHDYDVVLTGCGAYGFPLAAHAKRRGKVGIHLGGVLQLLFGIKGKRWENPNIAAESLGAKGRYLELFNDAWDYPDESLRPKAFKKVEGGCYW